MTGSPLKKFVLTPIVLSTTVFATLTLPLAVFGSKPVTIQLQQEPVFHGPLKDIATPYLGLATVISLGAGVASVAVAGWRHSSRKSSQVEAKLSSLAQNLKEKEAALEAVQLSKSRLEASGLSAFLDEEEILDQALKSPAESFDTQPVVEPLVITTQPVEAQPVTQPQVRVQAAAASFASAQNFLGYTQAKAVVKPYEQETSPAPEELEQLHNQLQEIMAQMASVQKALSARATVVSSKVQVPAQEEVAMPANTVPLQVFKSSRTVQEMAS